MNYSCQDKHAKSQEILTRPLWSEDSFCFLSLVILQNKNTSNRTSLILFSAASVVCYIPCSATTKHMYPMFWLKLTTHLMLLLLKCCFMAAETVGLLGTGAQDGHLDFHTAPEL